MKTPISMALSSVFEGQNVRPVCILAWIGPRSDRLEADLEAALFGIGHQLAEDVDASGAVWQAVEVEGDRAMRPPANRLQLALLLPIR